MPAILHRLVSFGACTALGAAFLLVPAIRTHAAEPPVQLLASAKASDRNGCSLVTIELNQKVSILKSTQATTGDELRIALALETPLINAHEAIHAPDSELAAIHAIEVEPSKEGAAVAIYFRHAVAYQVALGGDAKSLILAVSDPASGSACSPVAAASLDQAKNKAPAQSPSDAQIASLRAAIAKQDFDAAISTATALVQGSDRRYHQEAQELLGVALEAKGLRAQAKAEYADFLRLYPDSEGSERVKKRLAIVEAGGEETSASMKTTSSQPATDPAAPKHSDVLDGKPGSGGTTRENVFRKSVFEGTESEPSDQDKIREDWVVGYTASMSTFYERNQGGRDYFIPLALRKGWDLDPSDSLYAENLISAFDVQTHFVTAGFAGKFRVSGSHDRSFLDDTDRYYVSALYFDGDWRDQGITARIGRQSKYTGGVLGRFDGVSTGVQVAPAVKLGVTGGAPVVRSYDEPFKDDRYFYGTSITYTPWGKGTDFGLFFIEQRSEGLIDRQGIGAEFRYLDETRSAFATTDFDIHFAQLNSFLVTGSQTFADQSTLSLNFDYRRAPLLFTTNAIIGQSSLSLEQLLTKYRLDEIERFAIDRTAQSYEFDAGWTKPLTEHLTLNLDATVTYLSDTKQSAGVEASQSTGVEYFGSAFLTATDVFTAGDTVTGGVRYSDLQSSDHYLMELGTRVPLSESWRIGPLLRVGYVDYKGEDSTEWQFLPTVRASYLLTKDLVFDLEAGKKWILRDTPHGRENEDELLILGGVRYEFSGGAW